MGCEKVGNWAVSLVAQWEKSLVELMGEMMAVKRVEK